jgi:hypothetical protein
MASNKDNTMFWKKKKTQNMMNIPKSHHGAGLVQSMYSAMLLTLLAMPKPYGLKFKKGNASLQGEATQYRRAASITHTSTVTTLIMWIW